MLVRMLSSRRVGLVASRLAALGLGALLPLGCSGQGGVPGGPAEQAGGGTGGQTDTGGQAGTGGAAGGTWTPNPVLTSCEFSYDDDFVYPAASVDRRARQPFAPTRAVGATADSGSIAHGDPAPPYTWSLTLPHVGAQPRLPWVPPESLVLPGYDDDLPLFDRAAAWSEPLRCYETPAAVVLLTEPEAYDLYRRIAELTTGVPLDDTAERRSVVGLRGGYPGRLLWHDNLPDRFNDTLVLLWTESGEQKHVRELPANTDTGAHDFGVDSSSSLRPNRRYRYVDGWHKSYNALHIDEADYRVRDDSNHNGHWDSDRNGWLPPLDAEDHDRTGAGHNIHMGSVDAPLGTASVDVWSAGCQVIPGMANWIEFITNAWTTEGASVDYFLVDVRDIPADVWAPCTPDGSHRCPYRIEALPFSDTRSTASEGSPSFDQYNCSSADESGPEIVYLLTLDESGTLTVSVDCASPVDVDVHLLDGDDPNACLDRDDTSLSYAITPGRYLVVVDSFVSGGEALAGAYTLHVSLE